MDPPSPGRPCPYSGPIPSHTVAVWGSSLPVSLLYTVSPPIPVIAHYRTGGVPEFHTYSQCYCHTEGLSVLVVVCLHVCGLYPTQGPDPSSPSSL